MELSVLLRHQQLFHRQHVAQELIITIGNTHIIKIVIKQFFCSGSANPEENGDQFEGDIKINGGSSKAFINDPNSRWPNGVVPYVIEGSFSKQLLIGIL